MMKHIERNEMNEKQLEEILNSHLDMLAYGIDFHRKKYLETKEEKYEQGAWALAMALKSLTDYAKTQPAFREQMPYFEQLDQIIKQGFNDFDDEDLCEEHKEIIS